MRGRRLAQRALGGSRRDHEKRGGTSLLRPSDRKLPGRAEAFGEGGRVPPCRPAEAGRYDYRLRNFLTRSRKVCWVSGSATLVVRVARWRSSSARRLPTAAATRSTLAASLSTTRRKASTPISSSSQSVTAVTAALR